MGRPRPRTAAAGCLPAAGDLMSVHRFYAPRIEAPGSEFRLSPEEGRHLARVLRLRRGARVHVFDGRGRQHEATLTDDDPRRPVLRLGAPVTAVAEPLVHVTLGVTLLKGRKLDTVVRDATTLGVAELVPLLAHRAQAGGPEPAGALLADRWHGIAVAAAKQCGRAVVPAIPPPATFRRFVGNARREAVRLLLLEPSAAGPGPAAALLNALRTAPRPVSAVLATGPEGGWTDDEIRAAEGAGFRPLTLGRRTLRAETAPVAALSILRFVWDDF